MKSRLNNYKPQRPWLLLAMSALALLLTPCFLQAGEPALRVSSEGTFQEIESRRMWQVERSRKLKSVEEAVAYLADLNDGQYNDWRFPTKQELFDLFSIFDLKQNGEVKIRLEGNYWLAEESGKIHVGSWEIGDGCGPSRTYYNKKAGYVRAVRP